MTQPKLFIADQFTSTKFHSSQDKADFANHFVKFVESDYKETLFTKPFYTRLSNTFGHIAHYNQANFYDTFFVNLADKCRFASITERHEINGDPAWTFSDVEKALQAWAKEYGMYAKTVAMLSKAEEAQDRATLARLKARYEPNMTRVLVEATDTGRSRITFFCEDQDEADEISNALDGVVDFVYKGKEGA
jgi:hypothetical protein